MSRRSDKAEPLHAQGRSGEQLFRRNHIRDRRDGLRRRPLSSSEGLECAQPTNSRQASLIPFVPTARPAAALPAENRRLRRVISIQSGPSSNQKTDINLVRAERPNLGVEVDHCQELLPWLRLRRKSSARIMMMLGFASWRSAADAKVAPSNSRTRASRQQYMGNSPRDVASGANQRPSSYSSHCTLMDVLSYPQQRSLATRPPA